jgi:hypothetical protein
MLNAWVVHVGGGSLGESWIYRGPRGGVAGCIMALAKSSQCTHRTVTRVDVDGCDSLQSLVSPAVRGVLV